MALKDASLLRDKCPIDGNWVGADNGASFAVTNPATGEEIGRVPNMGAAEARRAIEAASAAWPAWRAKTAKERSAILRRWFNLIIENTDDLATLMTLENGKPLAEAKGEVVYAANFAEWYAEEAKRVYGETVPQHMQDRRILVQHAPIGVSVAITPWNFPAAMIAREVSPALAAGCPIVVKPAEQTPLTALALALLAERAGVPKGVFSVVTGDPEPIGGEFTANPIVRKLGFTGSNEVGKILMRQCAATVKKISLELGGNSPFIVFDDADIDEAVKGAMIAKFRNAGQTCVAANRFLVQDRVYADFARKYTEAVSRLRVGNGLTEQVELGPLIDEQGASKVERHVKDAIAKGAKPLIGGHRHAKGGTYFEPTILDGVNTQMVVTREETFGPVAALMRFETEEQAVQIANDTPFGLLAYVYTRDVGRSWRMSEALEFGMLGINTALLATDAAPMGGMKESGVGRVGGRQGIEEYLETKYVAMGGLDR